MTANIPGAAEIKTALSEILSSALKIGVDEIDTDRHFLEMGASSLVLVDTFRALHERFGVRPSMRKVFDEHTTIDKLSVHVAQLLAQADREIEAPRAQRL